MDFNQLTSLVDIKAALKLGPVYCDIAQPAARRLPVRDVRKFKASTLDRVTAGLSQTEWTTRFQTGTQLGYEVLLLEGWHVPEKVWRETKC